MTTLANDTEADQKSPMGAQAEAIAWCAVFSLEALVVIFTNLVTIIVFVSNTPLQKHTSILLTNLAFADLLIGLLVIPGWVYFLGANQHSGLWKDQSSLSMRIAYSSVDIGTAFASVTNHGCIAVERLVATLWPFKYKRNKRKLNTYFIAFSWICALLIPSITQVGVYLLDSLIFSLFVWLPFLSVLLLVITVSYSILLSRMRSLDRDLNHDSDDRRGQQRRGHRFTITAFIVTVVSLSSWLPFIIMSAINHVAPINSQLHLVNPVKMLHFFNSLSNPFIYWLRIPHYKQAVYEVVFRRKKAQNRAAVASSTSSSNPPKNTGHINTRF